MSDWQPIETAPKDGTRILALATFESGLHQVVVRWHDAFWTVGAAREGAVKIWLTIAATRIAHWQPLLSPPPPSGEGGK